MIALLSSATASAQLDTLGKYPFLYTGDFPCAELYSDSSQCLLGINFYRGNPDDHSEWQRHQLSYNEHAVNFHSQDTLRIIGVAIRPVHFVILTVTLRDTNMTLLATADDIYHPILISATIPADSSYHLLQVPGYANPVSSQSERALKFVYFDEPVDVVGEFYIGYKAQIWNGPPHSGLLLHIYENHDEPYHFTPQKYRMGLLEDGEVKSWEERVSLRSIPLLFPIVEPRCLSVDSVSVEADSTGCAWARWDSLPRQERWVVQYRSAGGVGGIDTVDTPEWRRCGLTQGERYEVRVRSRCTNLRSHTWSPWSAGGTALVPEPEPEPVGIGAVTAAAFEVSPNPAHGEVTVRAAQSGGYELTLYDAQGRAVRTVRNASGGATRMPLGGLAKGVYTLRLTSGYASSIRKLLVE